MKSPQQLATYLARQWWRADWRERQLLNGATAWPLRLPIGMPDVRSFRDAGAIVQEHMQRWNAIEHDGPGHVEWSVRKYRAGAESVKVPAYWILSKPSELVAAICAFNAQDGTQIRRSYGALAQVISRVDPSFHRLLTRRLTLWQGSAAAQVILAAQITMQLEAGCAQGRPLRALSLAGNDSKFFERHGGLIKALLIERFAGEVSRQGLSTFLGAIDEDDHWLLLAPLDDGLLPFQRMRVTSSELRRTPMPASHILLIENERCLHQLPRPLRGTIAILGAGLDLGWLAAPWLRDRHVAYWGDMDTWGLAMLATARKHLPHLQALLMHHADFHTHIYLAVAEPVHAQMPVDGALTPEESAMDTFLRTQAKGRIEQEFLPQALVQQTIEAWHASRPVS
ncbi:hypothetical protein SDC9_107915 [bioreactor metagenome]|uniref:Wadjet protein JetD C-terminal domain-containing protein n=1 Tax=bioreactor metagenome TaxID=1076179 RepID=A0A645B8V7_9ZZZZ